MRKIRFNSKRAALATTAILSVIGLGYTSLPLLHNASYQLKKRFFPETLLPPNVPLVAGDSTESAQKNINNFWDRIIILPESQKHFKDLVAQNSSSLKKFHGLFNSKNTINLPETRRLAENLAPISDQVNSNNSNFSNLLMDIDNRQKDFIPTSIQVKLLKKLETAFNDPNFLTDTLKPGLTDAARVEMVVDKIWTALKMPIEFKPEVKRIPNKMAKQEEKAFFVSCPKNFPNVSSDNYKPSDYTEKNYFYTLDNSENGNDTLNYTRNDKPVIAVNPDIFSDKQDDDPMCDGIARMVAAVLNAADETVQLKGITAKGFDEFTANEIASSQKLGLSMSFLKAQDKSLKMKRDGALSHVAFSPERYEFDIAYIFSKNRLQGIRVALGQVPMMVNNFDYDKIYNNKSNVSNAAPKPLSYQPKP